MLEPVRNENQEVLPYLCGYFDDKSRIKHRTLTSCM